MSWGWLVAAENGVVVVALLGSRGYDRRTTQMSWWDDERLPCLPSPAHAASVWELLPLGF